MVAENLLKNRLAEFLKNICYSIPLPAAFADGFMNILFSNSLFDEYFGRQLPDLLNNESELKKNHLRAIHFEYADIFNGYMIISEFDYEKITGLKLFAHDLNNYLSNALNSFDLLQQSFNEKLQRENMIESVDINLRKAIDLAVRSLSPPGAAKLKTTINTIHLVNDLVKSARHAIPERIVLKAYLNENTRKISVDYSDINRILLNILINAGESINGEGEIIIRSGNVNRKFGENSAIKEYVYISVKDTGCGIAPENMNKIFEENFSTKNKGRLSGIGLSSIRRILQENSGEIEIISELNQGSEFTVYFPAIQPLSRPVSGSAKKIILLGEDERELREVLSDMFRSFDYTVVAVESGSELLNVVLEGQKIDIFIIDINIPGINGLQCIKALRKMGIMKPVILATGTYQSSSGKEFEELNISKIINKPYVFDDLLNEVQILISA